MLYAIIVAILVALDQIVKFLVVEHIPLGAHFPFIPRVLELTYVKNSGAAFSLFSQHTWLLALVSLVLSIVLAVALVKNFFHHPAGKLTLAMLLAGAVGNLIDRVRLGFVVDMFNVLLFDFAVFNVADICVVLGGIAAVVYYMFFSQKLEPKSAGGSGNAPTDQAC